MVARKHFAWIIRNMPSEDVQTNLRLPAELKERLADAANQNKRSLSAEVAARLEATFGQPAREVVITGKAGDGLSMSISVPIENYNVDTLGKVVSVFDDFVIASKSW